MPLVLLILFVCAAFGLSVRQRAPWFGDTGANMAGAMTAGTAGMAAQWYRDGGWHLGFVMYWEPRSIETPTLVSRIPYVSYPSGAVIPIYFLSLALGEPPSPSIVMAYNLANQALIALLLALLVYGLFCRMAFHSFAAALTAGIAASLYLWMPSPFWEHQMGFFSDQAVLLPWALFVFLEMLRENVETARARRAISVVQGLTAFWGVYTDWLFLLVTICAFLVRVFRGGFRRPWKRFLLESILFWLPVAIALVVFLVQIHHAGALTDLAARFTYRTGVDGNAGRLLRTAPGEWSWRSLFALSFDSRFWSVFIPQGYGGAGKPLILLSAALFLLGISGLFLFKLPCLRRKFAINVESRAGAGDALSVMFLFLAPCFIHYQLLKEHSSFFLHSFAALKLALPLAVTPFVLAPAALVSELPFRGGLTREAVRYAVIMISVLCAVAYLCAVNPQRNAFYAQQRPGNYERPGAFIAANTRFEDIVVSNNFTIPRNFIVFSMKQVHQIRDIEDIQRVVKGVDGEYVLNLFSNGSEHYEPSSGLAALAAIAERKIDEGDFHLRKISRRAFEQLYPVPKIGVEQP